MYLVSDGAYEERNPAGEIFGLEAMANVLASAAGESLEASLQAVSAAVSGWRQKPGFADDLSLLALEIL